MTRHSISFTDPNSECLRVKVEVAAIREALRIGEESGMSDRTPQDIMNEVLQKKRQG